MQASHYGNKEAVEMLLTMKADPSIMGRNGRAIDLAKEKSVRDLLRESSSKTKAFEASALSSLSTACGSESVGTSSQLTMPSVFLRTAGESVQDLVDSSHKPIPRLHTEPAQDIRQSLRDAMSISCFNGTTSKFIDPLLKKAWSLAQDRIGQDMLKRHPGLTENGLFAVALFTMQLQGLVNGATARDEFYFQFGNAMRRGDAEETLKLQTYLYHFNKGLEAMTQYQGTLWRGIRGDFAKAAPDNFDQFSLVCFNGYSSASPDRKVAKNFGAGKGLLLRLDQVVSARDVREVSAYPNEEERTILAGTQFIVVKGAHMSSDGTMEIHLKEAQAKQV